MARWYDLIGLAVFLIAVSYHYRDDIRAFVARPDGLLPPQETGDEETDRRDVTPDSPQQKTQTKTQEQADKHSTATKQSLTPSTNGGTDTLAPEETPPTEYYNPPFDPAHPEELFSDAGTRLITLNELAAHGHSGPLKPIWLAVLGSVFDVDKGASRYYGPNGGYNFFTGLDGTRAYVTGEFNDEGLVDDIEGLEALQVGEIEQWIKFYTKDYTYVGKLIGRYYNRDGSPTKAWYKYKKLLGEQEKVRAALKELEKKFPGCNSRWNEQEGGTVFCSEKRFVNSLLLALLPASFGIHAK